MHFPILLWVFKCSDIIKASYWCLCKSKSDDNYASQVNKHSELNISTDKIELSMESMQTPVEADII